MLDAEALRQEILNDPMELGLVRLVKVGDDAAVAKLLNEASYEMPPTQVLVADLLRSLSPDDFAKLDADQCARWQLLLSFGAINAEDTGLRSIAEAMIGRGLESRQGSRGEILFGPGVVVTHADVGRALRQERDGGKIRGDK